MFYLSKVLEDGVFEVVNTEGSSPVALVKDERNLADYKSKLIYWLESMGFNRMRNIINAKAIELLIERGIPVYGYSERGSHKCYDDYKEVIKRYTVSMKMAGYAGAVLSDGHQGLSLKKYNGDIKRLVVPKFIVSIGTNCCSGNASIEEVEILNKNFGCFEGASFYRCINLRKVTLRGFVDTVMPHAFRECDNLSEFNGDYRRIEAQAFSRNRSLRSFDVSSKCLTIGHNAFERCDNLELVTFGHSLVDIQNNAFKRCRSLRKVVLPDSLEYLGSFVFDECRSLEEVWMRGNIDISRVSTCRDFKGKIFIDGE